MRHQKYKHPLVSVARKVGFIRWLAVALLFASAFASQSLLAEPLIVDDTISWPDDGWYEVQSALDYTTICEGGTECQVARGLYNVINHTSGDRWERLYVGPFVVGSTISWRGDDWYQVQDSETLATICEGRDPCTVSDGVYIVINLSTGKRWTGVEVPGDASADPENPADFDTASGRTLVLNLVGTGAMYVDTVPAAEGLGAVVEAWCFDVDLVDMKTGNTVGTATDCLDPSLNGQKLSESGLGMIGTTYFNLPDGVLAIQGRTTVQPRNWPTREFTHITGGNSAANAVLYGTGAYQGVSGTARLSGMVDLSRFDQSVGSLMTFDCLFVVELN
ncbi:MAG: hypothetical protein KTR32_22175 [Granulosicoccus sp.]|nr:hypothetical protein [Granulosicoccus sp.]